MARARRLGAPLALLAAGIAAAASPAVAADPEPKSWEVGAFVLSTTYDNDSLIADTIGFGARGGWVFKDRHEFELYLVKETADEDVKGSDETFDITRWSIDYVYNLKVKKPESKLSPFLLFGVGKMSYEGKGDSDSTTTFQTGGGVRVFMTKRFALRFDGRIFHFHGDNVIIPRDGWFSFDFTAGVSYFFGGGG
jgi:OmpA-OmpF porin, OOP family